VQFPLLEMNKNLNLTNLSYCYKNYRAENYISLKISGFLNANGSPLTRGQVANYGIMDQMAVLQWIQENIVQFGGDPQRVTLFGHGTGAACIEYLTHSPTTVPGKKEKGISLEPAAVEFQSICVIVHH